ncbi:MAG: NAD(P)H-dependent oxidoreductase [Oscillospiraceae bacterium]|nr:NAD(P)H-dependent oxidoreductase [Oscillospiraceae bacterium]
MKTLLFVDSCISQRGEGSRTRKLCSAFIDTFLAANPDYELVRVDVEALNLPNFTLPMIEERDKLLHDGHTDLPQFAHARQFAAADRVVVGAPYWDMAFPSVLRAYVEHICANRIGYCYGEFGQKGLCRADKLMYITSGGGFIDDYANIGYHHWVMLCRQFGIKLCETIVADAVDVSPELEKEHMAAALAKAEEAARSW